MARDPDIVVMGEDVGYFGGVFRATAGLQAKFGKTRVFDTPITECGIIGVAVGMGAYGLSARCRKSSSPTTSTPALDQLVSEAARLRYRSGGEFTSPITVRSPFGGGIFGGQTHSQSPEGIFTHVSGIKTVIPSTPYDAKGLLIAAIEDNDPTIFFEPKRIYNGPFDGHWDKPHTKLVAASGRRCTDRLLQDRTRQGEGRTAGRGSDDPGVRHDGPCRARRHRGGWRRCRSDRPAHARPARYRHDRGIGEEDRTLHDRARGDTHHPALARNYRRKCRSAASTIWKRRSSASPASTRPIHTAWNGHISPARCESARRSRRL